MNPIILSLLLGLTAATANVFGGAIIVQKHWERSYLRYFVALGAGFMLATSIVEMVPESLALGGKSAAFLVLLGYRSEEHTSELQSLTNLVCRLLLEKKKKIQHQIQ